MALKINRLSPTGVRKKKGKGRYADGNGLYLQISDNNTKSWLFRFSIDGKARQMGLGSVHEVSLKQARAEAIRCHGLLRDGQGPIEERKARVAEIRHAAAKTRSFRECAEAYIRTQSSGWKNAKHGKQWSSTLQTYVYPVLGDIPVADIETSHVTDVLTPIWATKTETASRVRGRVEAILDWAAVSGFRNGENPARWRGHLDKVFPKRSKVQKVRHHPSLPYSEMFEFMTKLDEMNGNAALGLKFTILTAARTGEVMGATWDEISLSKRLWTIPEDRMKAEKEHRVALSNRAIELLNSVPRIEGSNLIFAGRRPGRPLSNMAFAQLLKRIGYDDITVHGFRSTFRDWASEVTGYPSEVAEMALAHAVSDKVEAAYRRGDLLEKRFNLMDDWAGFCHSPPLGEEDNVVKMPHKA